jgi:hypothetical protein
MYRGFGGRKKIWTDRLVSPAFLAGNKSLSKNFDDHIRLFE